jgi:hypothetical protein
MLPMATPPPPPLCLAPAGWFCSPMATSIMCPTNYYCSGGLYPPRRCPDNKLSAEGSAFLSDCGDGSGVFLSTVLALIICFSLVLICIYCVLDWYQYQGSYYQVVQWPAAKEVVCPPERRCPAPSAPPAPSCVYYQETTYTPAQASAFHSAHRAYQASAARV